MTGLDELLRAAGALETVLRRNGWQFCFIGGVAVQRWGLPRFTQDIDLVRQKLAVPGNQPVDFSANRLAALRQQVGPQLQPVLRAQDFVEFDLDRAFQTVATMAARVT